MISKAAAEPLGMLNDRTSDPASRRGRRLTQLGVLIFFGGLLLGMAASLSGDAVHWFAAPRAAISAHLIALMQGTFLALIGSQWPKLQLSPGASRAAFMLICYGFIAALLVNTLAAVWGAGGGMLPLVVGKARGTAVEEWVIALGLRTAAVSQLTAVAVIAWGLRVSSHRGAAGDTAGAFTDDT